jgi:hypothetical protein
MVPDMFHVPMSAPTLNKMKKGVATEASAVPPHLETASQGCPFLRTTSAVTAQLRSNATCTGPSVEATPNRKTPPATRTKSVATGMMASAYDGSGMLLTVTDSSSTTLSSGRVVPARLDFSRVRSTPLNLKL